MRTIVIALSAVLLLVANGQAGEKSKKAYKMSPSMESKKVDGKWYKDPPIRELGDHDIAKGVIFNVDEKAKTFDVRTAKEVVRVRVNGPMTYQESLDSEPVEVSLQKVKSGKEYLYYTIILTDGVKVLFFKG